MLCHVAALKCLDCASPEGGIYILTTNVYNSVDFRHIALHASVSVYAVGLSHWKKGTSRQRSGKGAIRKKFPPQTNATATEVSPWKDQ